MDKDSENMWTIVFFDIPVKTKEQIRQATKYRKCLLENSFIMVQYSVYARYTPVISMVLPSIKELKHNLPKEGVVRILYLTDLLRQRSLKFQNKIEKNIDEKPEQYRIF